MIKSFARNVAGVVVVLSLASPTAAQTPNKSRTQQPAQAQAQAPADPLKEFEKIVQQCQAAAEAVNTPTISVYYNNRTSAWVRRVRTFEVRYDVRKTDSLVAPVVGQINVLEIAATGSAPDEQSAAALEFTIASSPRHVRTRTDVTFKWRDQKWTVKEGTRTVDFRNESGAYVTPMKSAVEPSKGTDFYGRIADCFPS